MNILETKASIETLSGVEQALALIGLEVFLKDLRRWSKNEGLPWRVKAGFRVPSHFPSVSWKYFLYIHNDTDNQLPVAPHLLALVPRWASFHLLRFLQQLSSSGGLDVVGVKSGSEDSFLVLPEAHFLSGSSGDSLAKASSQSQQGKHSESPDWLMMPFWKFNSLCSHLQLTESYCRFDYSHRPD